MDLVVLDARAEEAPRAGRSAGADRAVALERARRTAAPATLGGPRIAASEAALEKVRSVCDDASTSLMPASAGLAPRMLTSVASRVVFEC